MTHVQFTDGLHGGTRAGELYGRLTVLSPADDDHHGHRQVRCSCTCGGTLTVRATSLRQGLTRSCGCIGRERMEATALRLEGRRFGLLVAVSRVPLYGWLCRCDCGRETTAQSSQLKRGETTLVRLYAVPPHPAQRDPGFGRCAPRGARGMSLNAVVWVNQR